MIGAYLALLLSPGMDGAGSGTSTLTPTPLEETIKPTWETQKQARTYVLDIPAPRGQITDRNGAPLAQNKLSYNLTVDFPTPLDFSDAKAIEYSRTSGSAPRKNARSLARDFRCGNLSNIITTAVFSPSRSHRIWSDSERSANSRRIFRMVCRSSRFTCAIYPNKSVAGQVIGYTGRTSRNADGIIQNGQVLWPETEGREGLEQTFNSMLTGRHGKYKVTFDRDGRKTSERIVEPPVPAITSSRRSISACRRWRKKRSPLEPSAARLSSWIRTTGDILALASWPTFDPNEFIPSISAAKFKKLQNDPNIPLFAARLSFRLSAGIDL